MKKATRLIALLLACIFCFTLLAACGDGDGETTTAPSTTAPSGGTTNGPSGTNTISAKWQNVKFNGETLKVEYNTHTQPTLETAGAKNSTKFVTGPDAYSPNGVDKALWERNKRVIDHLGFTPAYSTDDTSAVGDLLEHYRALIQADSAPHIFVTQNYGLVRAEIAGYLHNLKDGYGTDSNHFVFDGEDAAGWYMDIMNSTTLANDQLYVASGDFLLDSLRMSYCTFVNASLFDATFSMMDGMDYLWELILHPSEEDADYAWSYDTMKSFADAATTINQQDDTLSTYGLLSNNFAYRSFFFSSGLEIFNYDAAGNPSYVTDITSLHNYTDALISLLGPNSQYLPKLGSAEAGNVKCLERFQNGLGLFMTDQFLCTLEGARLQDMDDQVAVIPYPKYDLAQDYRILVSDNANSGGICINSSAAEFTMASAYLQLMTEQSSDVIHQYFDVSLKLKNNKAEDPKQMEVLNLIREALAEPMPFLFDNFVSRELTDNGNPYSTSNTAATIYDLLEHAVQGNFNSLSAGWARNINQKRDKLASIIADFKDN